MKSKGLTAVPTDGESGAEVLQKDDEKPQIEPPVDDLPDPSQVKAMNKQTVLKVAKERLGMNLDPELDIKELKEILNNTIEMVKQARD